MCLLLFSFVLCLPGVSVRTVWTCWFARETLTCWKTSIPGGATCVSHLSATETSNSDQTGGSKFRTSSSTTPAWSLYAAHARLHFTQDSVAPKWKIQCLRSSTLLLKVLVDDLWCYLLFLLLKLYSRNPTEFTPPSLRISADPSGCSRSLTALRQVCSPRCFYDIFSPSVP